MSDKAHLSRSDTSKHPRKDHPNCCPECGFWLNGSTLEDAGRVWHADCLARATLSERDRLRAALLATIKLTKPQARALKAFDGYEATDPTNEFQVGMGGVGNVRMVMGRLCEIGLCVRREFLNEDEGYRYELTQEGSVLAKALIGRRHYVIESNA